MNEQLPILLGSEDERDEFYRSYRCCWTCFSEEMANRGYLFDIQLTYLREE